MKIKLLLMLLSSSLLASFGQILLKIGAERADSISKFINVSIFTGLCFYGLSTIMWIYALSFARLNMVYGFTTLTFVFVYILSFFILKEPLNLYGILGILFIIVGLYFILGKGSI